MFGNVLPLKESLSKEDEHIFRIYYCAVCKKIGEISTLSRLSLSYDMTFLAILLDSLEKEPPKTMKVKRCIIHPTKEMCLPIESRAVDYAAKISVILLKEKLKDDFLDDKNILKGTVGKIIKIPQDYTNEQKEIKERLKELTTLEKQKIYDPDMAADCFAKLCQNIFLPHWVDEKSAKVLEWMGYNLGRWIYLIDAVEDLHKDIKKGRYNPYTDKSITNDTKQSLFYTLSCVGASFDLLEIKRYKSLLENIVYAGLCAKQNSVFNNLKGK